MEQFINGVIMTLIFLLLGASKKFNELYRENKDNL